MQKIGIKEKWKDINGYKDLYQASSFGRIKTLCFGSKAQIKTSDIKKIILLLKQNISFSKIATIFNIDPKTVYNIDNNNKKYLNREKISIQRQDRDGYLLIDLHKASVKTTYKVHRLILETFVGPCPSGMECRHLDGNPANNRLENLCWGTRSENARDTVKHGKQPVPTWLRKTGENHSRAKLKKNDINLIKTMRQRGAKIKEIAKKFHLSDTYVYRILSGSVRKDN